MIYAVIPVKGKSERVQNKNFKPFYQNQSILDIKIQQLEKIKKIKKIFISSDKTDLKKYNNSKIQFIKRERKFCNNIIPWSRMIKNVINSLPANDKDIVLWCHTTSPLFDKFDLALTRFLKYEKKGFDSLLTTSEYKGFLLDTNLSPINYQWGKWHKYSQNIKSKFYNVNGALFIARKKTYIEYEYVIGNNPINYKCNDLESIDIDNNIDFNYAKYIFHNAKKKFH